MPIVVIVSPSTKHVARVEIGGGDDGAVLDQQAHGSCSAIGAVGVGPAIAIELPDAPHLFDHVEVHLGDDQLVLVLGAHRQEVAARIDEVGRAVEAADVPRRLGADAVAARHEVAVGHGVRRLFELPQVLRQPGDGGRRVEDDLGAVQPEQPRAFGKVPVVADVDADRREARLEHRIAEVARLEEVLLPEARRVRDVVLAVLPEVACRRCRRPRRCCSRRRPARARRPARPSPSGTSSRTAPSARSSGPAPARRCRTSARPATGRSRDR